MKRKLALSAGLATVFAVGCVLALVLSLGAGPSFGGAPSSTGQPPPPPPPPPATTPPPPPAIAYADETFQDHANNWNVAAGPWQVEDVGGGEKKYSNCAPAPGLCDTTNPTRAWMGVASDAKAYTISVDVGMVGNAKECRVFFTNADTDDNWSVDLSQEFNRIRVRAPAVTDWTPQGMHGPINGNAVYRLEIEVGQTQIKVRYQKIGPPGPGVPEPLEEILVVPTGIAPDGKVGVGTLAGDCDFDNFKVSGVEGIGANQAKLIPVFGYERTEACDEGPENPHKTGERMTELQCDRPLFAPWDRDQQAWWNTMVEEMDQSGVSIVAAHNRGCTTTNPLDPEYPHGWGDMCPHQLSKLSAAITARGSGMKIAMFDDLPTVGGEYRELTGQPFNLADPNDPSHTLWQDYLWLRRWERFYATVPANQRATVDGRPLIFIWDPGPDITNTQGNLSLLLDYLRHQVWTTTGANPFIVVSLGFWSADTTLANQLTVGGQQVPAVDAVFSWWAGTPGVGTQVAAGPHNGHTGATIVPGFRGWPDQVATPGPGCGQDGPPMGCREVSRGRGNHLIQALEKHKTTNFVLLEGWTNVIESAGWYRSLEGNDPRGCTQAGPTNTFDFPNQVINIVARYANPARTAVTLEAETADRYDDTTPGNAGGAYRAQPANSTCAGPYNDLDIGLVGGAYYVGWVEPGEWLQWRDVYLPAGTYRLRIEYSSPNADARVCAQVNGGERICTQNLASTGGWANWASAIVGQTFTLHKGLANWKLEFTQSALNVDKVIVDRIAP